MTQPFLGQIQPYGFGFAPRNWALCNGQILSIAQNTALFSLLGTMYGGNGTVTFALPNLQSRVPVHKGTLAGGPTFNQGEAAGVENVTLSLSQIPAHNHAFVGTSAFGNDNDPTTGAVLSPSTNVTTPAPGDPYYASDASPVQLNPAALAPYGSNPAQPHSNLQPYLTISWCIAMNGVFPSRN
jgi:microcystin-dependent protein